MPPDAPVVTIACGQALPGPVLATNTVEGEPGYAAALAALDLDAVVFPVDISSENVITRAVVNYTLGIVGQTQITQEHITAAAELGDAVRGAIAVTGDGSVDLRFLRRGLYYFTPCARKLPADLDAVRARYGDWTTWPVIDLPCSAPKNGPRKLYTHPEEKAYVAETLVAGSVRETEVLMLDQRTDGQLDFAAYTDQGELTDRSTFATASSSVVSSAPYTCMACHYDTAMQRYTDIAPTGTGAGCRSSRMAPPDDRAFIEHMLAD